MPKRTRKSPPIDSPDRRRLPPLLRRAWYGLNQAFRRRIAHLGVTPDQFTVMRTLREHDGISQRQLTTIISSDPNTVASLINRMEKAGLLERQTHEADRRANRLRLKPRGRTKYDKARALAVELQGEVLLALPKSAREKFLEQLDLIAPAIRPQKNPLRTAIESACEASQPRAISRRVPMRQFRIAVIAVILALAGVFLFLSWKNSLIVEAIEIRIKEGVREHNDHTLLGLGAEHRLPDYKITLNVTRRWLKVDLGTKLNTSATNWLKYPVAGRVPFRQLQEVTIIEDDKVENDVLDRIQISQPEAEGKDFRCRVSVAHSFEAGMDWFFATPLGKAIVIGIVMGFILLIGQMFRR